MKIANLIKHFIQRIQGHHRHYEHHQQVTHQRRIQNPVKQLRRNFLQKIAILQKGFLIDVPLGSKHVVAYAFKQTV